MISSTAIVVCLIAMASVAHAQSYAFTGFSADDVMTIGRALDKLLGADPQDRAFTDRAHLYDRIQGQITQQNLAFAKAKADADKAALDKAVADVVAKAKSEPKADQEPQP